MDLLSLYTYYFELPLYAKVRFEIVDEDERVFELMWSPKGINAYNPTIKENTTYFLLSPKSRHYDLNAYDGLIVSTLICSRTKEKVIISSFLDYKNGEIQKIGQHPSIAHFHISKIKDYQKVLENEKIKELTRAIGLAANGVGIGSFVYLRRIFEHLIEKEHAKAKQSIDWDEEKYGGSKMSARIELLRDYLPNFLFENKNMYGILSIGIHSLEENECLKYFETVKIGIELILDEELDKYEKEQKVAEAKKRIGIVTQQIREQNK